MWERFSYYGMRALLVLYLVNALGYQRRDALAIYGTYAALRR
jgi:POT family proton-dependent oligopeptide transporter